MVALLRDAPVVDVDAVVSLDAAVQITYCMDSAPGIKYRSVTIQYG